MDFNPVSMFESAVRVVKENKMLDIIKTILIITLLLYIGYHVNDLPDIVRHAFETRNTEMQMEHDSAVERRRLIKPQVDAMLLDAMNTLKSDRVYVVEMHNGTNNTAGLPFIYGEMTYEQTRKNIEHVDEDYLSVNLSRFEYPLYLEKNHFFSGTVDELSDVDEKLAHRMRATNVTYLAGIAMHGAYSELGYVGVSYCGNEPPSRETILSVLSVLSQKLTALLDMPEDSYDGG